MLQKWLKESFGANLFSQDLWIDETNFIAGIQDSRLAALEKRRLVNNGAIVGLILYVNLYFVFDIRSARRGMNSRRMRMM